MSKEHIVRPDQPVYTENNLKQLYLSTGSTQSPKDVGDSKHYQLGYSKVYLPELSALIRQMSERSLGGFLNKTNSSTNKVGISHIKGEK